MGLFVKFCRYNEYTIKNLICDEIYFSTVYKFNDFNELSYIPPPEDKDNHKQYTLNYLKSMTIDNFTKLIQNAKQSGSFKKEWIDNNFLSQPIDKINTDNIEEKQTRFLLENICYSHVGIFCCSGINVFSDSAAQLMFAHYADNNTGLALIYEIPDKIIHEVKYNKKRPSICGPSDRYQNWINGEFEKDDMFYFLNKAVHWQYEHEHRLFNKPGSKKLSDLDIELKYILHTPKFSDIEFLKKITKDKDDVVIQEIYASYGCDYNFRIDATSTVFDWINNNR